MCHVLTWVPRGHCALRVLTRTLAVEGTGGGHQREAKLEVFREREFFSLLLGGDLVLRLLLM